MKDEEKARAIADRIAKLCVERDMSVAELCRCADIPQTSFSNWKNRGSMPSIQAVQSMAEVLGVSANYLMEGNTVFIYDRVDSLASFSVLEERMSMLPPDVQEQLLESFLQIVELME